MRDDHVAYEKANQRTSTAIFLFFKRSRPPYRTTRQKSSILQFTASRTDEKSSDYNERKILGKYF